MKILMLTLPSPKRIARDMAGGLGFEAGDNIILPPLDLLSYAATFQSSRHTVKLVDATAIGQITVKQICLRINEFRPDLIITLVSLPTFATDLDTINSIHQTFPRTRIIIKTAITDSVLTAEMINRTGAELVIWGEADLVINEIIAGTETRGTSRLCNGNVSSGEPLIIEQLDKLPFAARELVTEPEIYFYTHLGTRITTMQTSRGCPYTCAFYCPYPLVQGKKWRSQSVIRVIKEIVDVVNVHKINKLFFRDATFTLDKNRVSEICQQLINRNLKVEWWCETRVDCLTPELVGLMYRAGCRGMNVGVETGDLTIMERQAKPGLSLAKLTDLLNQCRSLGLRIHLLFMLGLPTETKNSLYRTYKLIRELNPDSVGVTFVTPYPGTDLYREAQDKKWIDSEAWYNYDGHHPVMHTDNFTGKDLTFLRTQIFRMRKVQRYKNSSIRYLGLLLMDWQIKLWVNQKWN